MTMATATITAVTDTSSRWSLASLSSALPSLNSSPSSNQFNSSSPSFPQRHLTLSLNKQPQLIPSFTGLASANHLISLGFSDCTSLGHCFTIVDNGRRISAMSHGRRVPKLNRPLDQRRAFLRGLTTQLLKHYITSLKSLYYHTCVCLLKLNGYIIFKQFLDG
ncbi:50S ribosomal protein L17, chloroplastic-like [Mangifera indica]|uniref:50S ribosomal protein L17, chloroplastic-like n=1 Tax=Mangifera indica TaxID=29780 RepID=UPI001CFBEC3E|nr:50S ribosomal protein L17, chloroplastic-like [Mangifera indica]